MKEKLIDNTLENFDFGKVKKVMDFLDWKWANTSEFDSVPSIYQIIKSARKGLEDAYSNAMEYKENSYCNSGGLKAFAEYSKETNTVGGLGLEFVLTDWSVHVDDE